MKNTINIFNPNTGNQKVSLTHLKELICQRRLSAFKNYSHKKNISVHTIDTTIQQVAAHYPSFKIRQFNTEKAIEVFNLGGCQKATLCA